MSEYRELDLPSEEYQQSRIRTTLEHGEPTAKIRVRVTGTVQRTSGSTGDASVYPDHLQRLVGEHEMRADSFDLMESAISVRDLYEHHRLCVSEVRSRDEVDAAEINSGNAEDFDMSYTLHGHLPYMLNPAEFFWPAWDGRRGPELTNGFYLYTSMATAAHNASSDPGTGAIFSAGSDTYEFTSGPTLEFQQVILPGMKQPPTLVPAYEVIEEGDIQSALSNRPIRFDNSFTWLMLMIRAFHGSDLQLEDDTFLQNIGLVSSSTDLISEDTPAWSLEEAAVNRFIGYHGQSGAESSPATLPIDPVGGRVTQRVNPRRFTDLRVIADSEALQSTPGTIHLVETIGKGIDGVTKLKNNQ